jgi:hypothetical protein
MTVLHAEAPRECWSTCEAGMAHPSSMISPLIAEIKQSTVNIFNSEPT